MEVQAGPPLTDSNTQFPTGCKLPDLPTLQLECVLLEDHDFLFPGPEGDPETPASLGEAITEARTGQHCWGQHPQGYEGHIPQASHQFVPGQHKRNGLPTHTGRAGRTKKKSTQYPSALARVTRKLPPGLLRLEP